MLEKIQDVLDFSYENCASYSYLAVKTGMPENILEYQVSMVENNRIERMIPFEIKRKNGCTCFYYNITSRLALSFFLKRKKLGRNEFVKILSDIARTLIDSSGYLLSESCFIMEADYIYINPETLELSLIYVPVTVCSDTGNTFRDFITGLILHHVNIDEYDTDNFLQKILAFAKNDLFSITEFSCLLDSLLYSRDNGTALNTGQDESAICEMPGKDTFWEKQEANKSKSSRHLTIAALSQFIKYFFIKKPGAIRVKSDIQTGSDQYSPAAAIAGAALAGTATVKEGQPVATHLSTVARNGNTVLLGSLKRDFPILKCKNAGEFEDILIDKPDFIIGRLADQVDHVCGSNAVGKVHSQIISREGICCIKDLNSKNGTFLNNSRIESNKEYEIRGGDLIAFANCEYVFISL